MLIILIILISLELLTFLVLKEHYYKSSRLKFYITIAINVVLSIWFWYILIRATTYKGFFDTPENIRIHMNLAGMIFAVIIPRFIVTLLHYAGRLIRIRKGGHYGGLTETGIVIAAVVLVVIASSTLYGRFNFRTENITVHITKLDPRLEGLKILHISDMHLASFNRHAGRLQDVIAKVNSYQPDLIINTGDYISYGWREFDRFDTILAKARSRYGNLTVLGNHDMGTYFPNSSEADKESNVLKMKELIAASGYRLLDNEHIVLDIRGVNIEFIGVATGGRYPGIIHTDIRQPMEGSDTADLKILLIHDPNQWIKDVVGKTDIELTLAGHTHGMQIGIITKKFRWSPAKYIYPQWNGLYTEGDQHLYVNRGLGVLGIPFRIWMPPEITVITLSSE
jgi:predicted MPP superfamily phosphohydrolase